MLFEVTVRAKADQIFFSQEKSVAWVTGYPHIRRDADMFFFTFSQPLHIFFALSQLPKGRECGHSGIKKTLHVSRTLSEDYNAFE